jgi:hypothetical protein
MKKKSASQSAPARRNLGEGGFFNLRVLIGLFVLLAGVFLALGGLGVFSAASTAQAQQNYTLGQSIDPSSLPGSIVPRFTSWASISKRTFGREPS